MGASPSATVVELVERFEKDRRVSLSSDNKEEQLRVPVPAIRRSTFVARTFLAPVIHEESIKACPERSRRVAGASKAPDHTFRIGGRRHRTGLGTRTPLTFGLCAAAFRLYCEVNYGHN